MIAHRETLRRVVHELIPEVVGAQLVDVHHDRHRRLIFRLHLASGELVLIEVWLRAGLATLFRRPARWGMPEGLVPWAEELWGASLNSVLLHPSDRRVDVYTHRGDRLSLFLFGTAQSGALLVSAEGSVRALPPTVQQVLESLWRGEPLQRVEWRAFRPETPLYRALARSVLQLGVFYAREICLRCGITPERPLGELSEGEQERIETEIHRLLEELEQSSEVLLLKRSDAPPLLSLLPLREYPELIARFSSMNEAVAERVRRTLILEAFQCERDEVRQQLERYRRRISQHLADIQEHLQQASRIELYRLWGYMLLSQPELRQRGLTELEVQDWEGKRHWIPLEPALTVYENANSYFQRARRMEASLERARQQMPLLQRRYSELLELDGRLLRAVSRRDVRAVAQRLEELFPPREMQLRKGERVRVFVLGNGFRLYVGKDARSNDMLTFGFARPHDLFLHVRGGAGSHGLLRGQRKGELPPLELLRHAAAIVAYYSELRSASSVPVAYTWRKYVRKVKGTPGAVRLEREEVLWVRPMAPMGWESW